MNISMTPSEAYYEAKKVYKETGKRSPELEDIIKNDAECAHHYALNVIQDRWVEAEDVIVTDVMFTFCYAFAIIKGKLPDRMHEMMISKKIKYGEDWHWVSSYFEFLGEIHNSKKE